MEICVTSIYRKSTDSLLSIFNITPVIWDLQGQGEVDEVETKCYTNSHAGREEIEGNGKRK